MPQRPEPDDLEVPSTLRRSEPEAQRLFAATLASAIETYGEGERARRTAYASLKHSYEKVGDHWERKAARGPSDERAASPGARRGQGRTRGGVDAHANVAHLRQVARRLDIPGRSRMRKDELVEAIERANRRETARARRSG